MIPGHIAIIMDGNRRWAKQRGMPALAGHSYVANKVLEPLVEHAAARGVRYLTIWAFSTENWSRSKQEVSGLMLLLKKSLGPFGKRMMEKGVRLRVIGDISRLSEDLRQEIREVVAKTAANSRITVVIAINYGGRDEIKRAVRNAPDKNDFEHYLDTAGIPDPDFIIRTGGEQRLSGFLLWQSQYSELYFPEFYMPDFTPSKLDDAIAEFESRQRRFGK